MTTPDIKINEELEIRRRGAAWWIQIIGDPPPVIRQQIDDDMDRYFVSQGCYDLLYPGSHFLSVEPHRTLATLSPEERERFPTDFKTRARFTFLAQRNLAPSLLQEPDELVTSMDNAARQYISEKYAFTATIPQHRLWSLLFTDLPEQAMPALFETIDIETKPPQKNFPLGAVLGETSVNGLKARLDPIEATRILFGGLIGRKRISLEAAQKVFDEKKLARARQWIKASDIRPERLFRTVNTFLNTGNLQDAMSALNHLRGMPNEDVADLVAGVTGLFEKKEQFSSLVIKMQDGVFEDFFDNTRFMSCTFLPRGMYWGAAFRYFHDPDIGLLHIVPQDTNTSLPPIGVGILVNAHDAHGHKWLIVDSIEGGLDLQRVRDSLWIPPVYEGILSVARTVNAESILFNYRVYNGGRARRFLEYVEKRLPRQELYLRKTGLRDFSHPGIPEGHIEEALETWRGGQTEGKTSGYIAAVAS